MHMNIGTRFIDYFNLVVNGAGFNGYIYFFNFVWATRAPRELSPFKNITKVNISLNTKSHKLSYLCSTLQPFPQLLWILILVTLIVFALLLFLTYTTYRTLPTNFKLLSNKKIQIGDFMIMPLTRFVEHSNLNWFNTLSTGTKTLP